MNLPFANHPIRVALMCENPMVYRSLSSRLAADPAFEVSEATDCQLENVPGVMARDPQVVLLGVSHITHFNLLVCQAIRQASPTKPIVVLPSYEADPADEQRAHAVGVSAIILKNIDTPALVDQIRALVDKSVA
jgi:DNA-binding NarL/FixJ family response regulator